MNSKSVILILACLISFSSLSQQLNKIVLENWNNGAWENRMQQLPSYDEEGRISKNEIAHWNSVLKVWEDQTKTVFSRDKNGNLLTRETFEWLEDQSIWQATIRSSYSINKQNKPATVLNEIRNEAGWVNQSIDEYTYDANGKMIERRNERWDKNLMSWVPSRKFNYVIESNRKAGYTIYFWESQLKEWQEYKKANYHYSEANNIESISFESWIDGEWKNHSIRRNAHDEQGMIHTMDVDLFDQSAEIWGKSSHVDYELTDFGKISKSTSKKWDGDLSVWNNLQKSTYSYSNDGDVIEEWSQSNESMEIFPNPAMESITIRSIPAGTIRIIDALGKVVLQTKNNDQEEMQLDVSKWEIGVYSVQVNGNEVQQFVKQ